MIRKLSMDQLGRISVEEFKLAVKSNIVVILDNVRSMYNVGSVFRTSDAFLMEAVYLCGYTPQPPHRDIHKTALGATETVEWHYYNHTTDAVLLLKEKGYKVFAIEQAEGSTSLDKFTYDGKIAVVFGNEVEGVDNEVMQLCDGCIEIPQFGTKHSFNISVAVGIVLWELSRTNLT